MKTKRGILNERWDCEQEPEELQTAIALNASIGLIELAMDQYSQQQAISFAEWMADKNDKEPNPFVPASNGGWIQQCGNSTSWSTEELYNLFLSQQKQ